MNIRIKGLSFLNSKSAECFLEKTQYYQIFMLNCWNEVKVIVCGTR